MITLHTGLPGAGKTLYSIWFVRNLATSERRRVYYHGIKDLRVPGWVELDEEEIKRWWELESGAIILIDEAQRLFRPRAPGASVPEHVEKLETHRHKGHDLFLITQHPMLLDSNTRRLTGKHRHLVRMWGASRATVHEWDQVFDQVDKSRASSIKSQWSYPKELFQIYKSAEVHTHKMRLPFRVMFLIASPLVIAGVAYVVVQAMGSGVFASGFGSKAASSGLGGRSSLLGGTAAGGVPGGQKLSRRDWVEAYRPRVVDIPASAPVFDSLTAPKSFPRIAACVRMGDRCSCYSQQATVLKVEDDMCRQVVAHGYFDSSIPDASPTAPAAPAQRANAEASPASAAPMVGQVVRSADEGAKELAAAAPMATPAGIRTGRWLIP
jgi:hypothetical protein